MSVTVVDKIVGNLIECAHGDGVSTVFMTDIMGPLPTANSAYYKRDWQGTYQISTTARTNYAPNSNNPSLWSGDASGTGSAPTMTANYSVAPDGTMTASRAQMNKGAGTGFSRLIDFINPVPSGAYCDSLYVKTNDGSYVSAAIRSFSDGRCISVTPNWERFSATMSSAGTVADLQLLLWSTFGSSQTADLSVWGGQCEIGTASQAIAPNNAAISQSGYCAIATKDATKVRLVRPIVDGQGFETCNPGAKIARFSTNSKYICLNLAYTGLVTRADTYNAIGWVLVDGALKRGFSKVANIGSSITVYVELFFDTNVPRQIEVLCPYCASVDFVGMDIEATATLSPAVAAPSTRIVTAGDSITHGFYASDISKSWSFMLANGKGWELLNLGYGGRQCVSADGTALANLSPSVATYLIGYNDFASQVALATFKSNYTGFINAFRAVAPSVKLYCITPLYTSTVLAIPIESYRQQIRDALTDLGNPLNVLVEGTSLTDSGAGSFYEGIHPNDLGCSEIAAHLNQLVTP